MGTCTFYQEDYLQFEPRAAVDYICPWGQLYPSVIRKDRCIFHLPNLKEYYEIKKNMKDSFIKLITSGHEKSNIFIGFIFPISFSFFEERLKFKAEGNFSNATMRLIDLSNCDLTGSFFFNTDLRYSRLTNILFNRCEFHYTNFTGSNIVKCYFNNSRFIVSNFCGCRLRESTFNDTLIFGGETGRKDIREDILDIGFDLELERMIRFLTVDTKNIYEINTNNQEKKLYISLSNTRFEMSNLSKTQFLTTNIGDVDFSNSNLTNTDFLNARFGREFIASKKKAKKYEVKEGESYWDNKWYDINSFFIKIKMFIFKLFSSIFRAKEYYEKLRIHLPVFVNTNISDSIIRGNATAKREFVYDEYIRQYKIQHPIISKIWSLIANFGRSLRRWVFVSLLIATVFGIWFSSLGTEHFYLSTEEKCQVYMSKEVWPFYFSVVTFTTLGFGDITPITDVAAIAVSLEVVFGYIMLGGLLSILAHKIARHL